MHMFLLLLPLPPSMNSVVGEGGRGLPTPSNTDSEIGTKKHAHTCVCPVSFGKNVNIQGYLCPYARHHPSMYVQQSRARKGAGGKGEARRQGGSHDTPNSRKPNVTRFDSLFCGESFASSWVVNRSSFPVRFLILWHTTRGSIVMYACVHG